MNNSFLKSNKHFAEHIAIIILLCVILILATVYIPYVPTQPVIREGRSLIPASQFNTKEVSAYSTKNKTSK